jgi:hypothetical protein
VTEALLEVRARCGGEDDKLIIALGELIGLVAFASQRADSWRNRTILYGGDNQVAISWLASRAARNRYARGLLRILAYLELTRGFRIVGAYLRTYHNTWPDFFLPMHRRGVHEHLGSLGLECRRPRGALAGSGAICV